METKQRVKPGVIVNRSAPSSTIVPVLVYEDVGKIIDWLCNAFGFAERLRASGRDGKVTHAQLSFGEGDIMIGLAGSHFRPPRPGEVNQYVIIRVEDADAHLEQARRFGARIVQPLTDMPFGERMYTAEDAGGHRWTFSQSIADVAPETWGATVKTPR